MQDGDDTPCDDAEAVERESGARAADETLHGTAWPQASVDDAGDGSSRAPLGRRVGDLVGRYVLLEPIGAGGMGVVHRAYDPELDRHVALKLLRVGAQGRASESARLRLLREAQALAKLSHRNVVAVFDVGTTAEEVFMAMELVDGIDLLSRLRAGVDDRGRAGARFRDWREAVRTLVPAGSGLAAAHDLGLVHRDFKPGNVLLARGGNVLVTDFGLARVDDARPEPTPRPATSGSAWLEIDLTVDGALMGTPGYMAPEQHRGVPADARADQYAFTTTLWECIYGARPFAHVPVEELAARKAAGPPPCPPRPSTPAWLRRVLQRGLAGDPSARFPDMHALLRAIEDGPRRRRHLVLAGAAGLAAIALVGLVVDAGRRADPCPPEIARTGALVTRWASARAELADASIDARLDDLLARRSAALHEACRATFVLGQRSRTWFERRERCAARQAVFVDAALARLASPGERPHAHALLDAVPAVDECDETVIDGAAELVLADAEMMLAGGAIAAALGRIGELDGGLEDDVSIAADGLRARASSALGDVREAERRLLGVAARARGAGRARLEARLWAALARLALTQTHVERAALLVDLAVAAAPEEPGEALAGELAQVQGELALAQGDRAAACERFTSAATLLERAHGRGHGRVIELNASRGEACTTAAEHATQ